MLSQWDCLLKNLGVWQGSFTRLSDNGEELEDTPTIVSLEGRNDRKTVYQVVRRLPPNLPPKDLVLEYSSLSNAIRFFENGAFCQGAMQWGVFSEFGAEFGLIEGSRRLRAVIIFNKEAKLDKLTLIREKLPDSSAPERPHLTVDSLIGTWRGEATTIYPDWRNPDIYSTELEIVRRNDREIEQKLSFGDRTITTVGRIENSSIHFDNSNVPVRILLLPDGSSCNFPKEIKLRQPFFLEVGWLCQPNLRYRLIRSYGDKGEWVSQTLVREEKVQF
jgi:Domain of unknown function (DUF3598)